jgi:Rha family phage regulatory protein
MANSLVSCATAPVLATTNGKITTTTREVAANFGKRHATVLRALENLDCSDIFTQHNFALSEYIDETGRALKQYTMTRDGFAFLCMGFTGATAAKWKEAYISAFNAMEAKLLPSQPSTITPIQKLAIRDAVHKLHLAKSEPHQSIYSRFYHHFGISAYAELPQTEFDCAIAYLGGSVQISSNTPTGCISVNATNLSALCQYVDMLGKHWDGGLYASLKAAQSPLAVQLYDVVGDMRYVAGGLRSPVQLQRA